MLRLHLLAMVGLLLLATTAKAANVTVADKFLILTNPNGVSTAWRMISFLEQTLTQDGIIFDVVVFDSAASPRLDLKSVFWNADGSGKYRGYYMYPNLEAIGDLTKAEVLTIWDYQAKTGVRSAKFGVWVTTLGFYPKFDASGSQELGMQFTPVAPLGTSDVPVTAALTAKGLWRTPGDAAQPLTTCAIWANDFALTGIAPGCKPTPMVTLNADPTLGTAFAVPSITGVTVAYDDGRETMGFVHDCAAWSPTCLTLAHVAADWMRNAPNVTVDASTVPVKPPAKNVVMDHRVLVLTVPGFTATDFLERTLRAYGTPYDLYRFDKDASPRLDLQWLLWNADGSGKYSSYIMYPNLEALGHLTKAEVAIVWDYQKKTGARSVKFAAWPSNVGWEPNFSGCSANAGTMTFTAAAPFGISGVRAGAQLSTAGLYRCPGLKTNGPLPTCGMWASDFSDTGIVPACTATSILEVPEGVVGTLVKYGDGRESMAFVFDCATWSTACSLISHVVVAWMNQNIIPGQRRSLLTVQMDDFFLSTACTSCPLKPDGTVSESYQASVADMRSQIAFQEVTVKSWPNTPPGTDIRLDLPYNGNGVLETAYNNGVNSGYLTVPDGGCADNDMYSQLGCNCWAVGWQNCPASAPEYCRTCTKDRPKPLGTGADRVPPLTSLPNGWPKAILSGDPRAVAIMADVDGSGITNKFFWSHHTFTHENLDNATVYDAAQQVRLGNLIASSAHLNLASKPTFSSKCMVTPQISGLVNGDALSGLKSQGIECTTGDNTWAHLRNLANPYQMLYSNVEKNGYDGFAFLPRFATEIYFNCSTAAHIESVYNTLYQSYYGAYSTIDDIVKREAVRVVREGLLAMRHDPYMMHQANMVVDSTGQSLVSRWLKAVLTEFHSVVNWPVQSKKLDDLYAIFKEREARDACKLSYRLEVTPDKKVKTVTVSSGGGACTAPLTTPPGTTADQGTFEAVGADAPTLKVPLAAGGSASFSVGGLSWSLP